MMQQKNVTKHILQKGYPKRFIYLIVALIAFICAFIAGYISFTSDYMTVLIMSAYLCFFTLIPSIVILIFLIRWRNKKIINLFLWTTLLWWVLFLIFLIPANYTSDILITQRIEKSKIMAEEFAQYLQDYYQENKCFPSSLQSITENKKKFNLSRLTERIKYQVYDNGQGCILLVPDTRHFSYWTYNVKEARWFYAN